MRADVGMPRSPTRTARLRPNRSRRLARVAGTVARVAGAAGHDPHRDRPTAGVGQQRVLDPQGAGPAVP